MSKCYWDAQMPLRRSNTVKTPYETTGKFDIFTFLKQHAMNIVPKIKRRLKDPLQTFRIFEVAIALVCIVIPALLKIADSDTSGFRSSISDYVSMGRSYVFGMLLSIAALLFIFNGAVYFRNEDQFSLSKAGKWYNIILGLSLLAVILLPYKQYGVPHFIFAGLFFIGNALVIAIFHKKQYAIPSIILAVLTIVTITLHFYNQTVSIFTAEWLSLTVIGVHLIMEATGANHCGEQIAGTPAV